MDACGGHRSSLSPVGSGGTPASPLSFRKWTKSTRPDEEPSRRCAACPTSRAGEGGAPVPPGYRTARPGEERPTVTLRPLRPPDPRSALAGRHVVVTGGAGFVGSWTCEALLDAGARVLCVDSLLTGSVRNIAHLWDRPGFRFVEAD